ncbi:MAG: hypothetical protein D6773_02250 [Alphaproteobacteria bacterium]|nr:MAG: hypothetical protein D6773_02250 [Alphaproteobacteria bacterium]
MQPKSRLVPAAAILAVLAALLAARAQAEPEREARFRALLDAHNRAHLENAEFMIPTVATTMIKSEPRQSDERDRGPWELRAGAIALHVALRRTESIDVAGFPSPLLTLRVDGVQKLVSEGSPALPDLPLFTAQLVELDPHNPHPEIVFSSYTGGAHCCSDTRVLVSDSSGESWRELKLGLFDGDRLTANDLDGDGRFELAMRDNAFLYTFGCYACSAAPLRILKVERGKIVDASSEPRFRDAHVTHLARMIRYAPEPGLGANGFLAGYVAQKIRLGEGDQAWKLMLDYHDRETDWGLDHCTAKLNEKGECPAGKTVTLDFPAALKRFLKEQGYPLPAAAR